MPSGGVMRPMPPRDGRVVGMPIHQNIIDNPKSERVRRVADLSNRRSRERSGRFLAEGPQSVREAGAMHATDRHGCVCGGFGRSGTLPPGPWLARHGYEGTPETMPDDVPVSALLSPIVAEAVKAGLYVHLCSAGVIERMSRDAQGIVAVGDMQATRDAMTGTVRETPGVGGLDGCPSLVAGLLAGARPRQCGSR